MTGAGSKNTKTPPNVLEKEVAESIRLVILDVDGVLTDGGVYMGEMPDGSALEMKRFDIQDGLGIKLLQLAGIEVAIVSGRVSEATSIRARELGIDECHQDGGAQKIRAIEGILERLGLDWDQAAFLADDLPDLAVLRRVGVPAVVGNARDVVIGEAVWQARSNGGQGAVREFCEAILMARGDWEEQVEAYVSARNGEGQASSQ